MEREQPPEPRPQVELSHAVCPYCKDPVRPSDPKAACDACMAWHHRDCWNAHGRCSACGATAGMASTPLGLQASPADPREQAQVDDGLCRAEGCVQPRTAVVGTGVRVTLPVTLEAGRLDAFCPQHAAAGVKLGASVRTVTGVSACVLGLVLGIVALSAEAPLPAVLLLFSPLVFGGVSALSGVSRMDLAQRLEREAQQREPEASA